MRVLVTGGAGFIGSHLVDYLLNRGEEVYVLDNFSAGKLGNLHTSLKNPHLRILKGDLLRPAEIKKAINECESVYHLAANPEIRSWLASPRDHFKQNIEATYNLLEAIRAKGGVEILVFASSSTVYGEATIIPTPEDYAPLKPISLYGASKLAAEALISAYASMYGFRCIIYRMANVIGPRCSHGVVYDFVENLRRDPTEIEVLGDGSQSKSYLHVHDCVDGMVLGAERAKGDVEILNIGSEDKVDVKMIARIVKDEMDLSDAAIRLTGGVDGGRGWKGDVKVMQLDISRIRSLGWSPRFKSAETVRETARVLART